MDLADELERVKRAMASPYDGGIWEGARFNRDPFVTVRLADMQAILAALGTPRQQPAKVSDLVERLLQIRGTQFTPIENALVTEAADALASRDAEIASLKRKMAEAVEVTTRVIGTGINGGDNMRLVYTVVGGKALSNDLLAKAEESQAAVEAFRAFIASLEREDGGGE